MKIEPKLVDVNTKIDILEINQRNLVNDFVRLSQANEVLRQENSKFKESVKEYREICTDLHKTLALTQVSFMNLEEKLVNQEMASYDGIFFLNN